MDSERFDCLTRAFVSRHSRRSMLAGLLGGGLGLLGVSRAAALPCRQPERTCREDANCCSDVCLPRDATGRRRCACPGGEPICETFVGRVCCEEPEACWTLPDRSPYGCCIPPQGACPDGDCFPQGGELCCPGVPVGGTCCITGSEPRQGVAICCIARGVAGCATDLDCCQAGAQAVCAGGVCCSPQGIPCGVGEQCCSGVCDGTTNTCA